MLSMLRRKSHVGQRPSTGFEQVLVVAASICGVAFLGGSVVALFALISGPISLRISTVSFTAVLAAASGALATLFAVTVGVLDSLRVAKRADPTRPADPDAGIRLAALTQAGGRLHATTNTTGWGSGWSPTEVTVETSKSSIVFRQVQFLTGFARSHHRACVEMSLSDLLYARVVVHRGGRTLQIHTTHGKLGICGEVQPFDPSPRSSSTPSK